MVVPHAELTACREHLYKHFTKAMRNRDDYDGDGWIVNERRAITEAANMWALGHGLNTITEADVERIEHQAVGHVDYARKLPLYVSEMLYGLEPWV